MAAIGTETATPVAIFAHRRVNDEVTDVAATVEIQEHETVVRLSPSIEMYGDPADLVQLLTALAVKVARATGQKAPSIPPF
jgi:hypothetical protein